MKQTRLLFTRLIIGIGCIPISAHAHIGALPTFGLIDGFSHPFSGFDHLLVMIIVGIIASQVGGRAQWTIPLTFLGVMIVGSILGGLGVMFPYVELGIALSILTVGILLTFSSNFSTIILIGLIGFFALFHGHAHGTEMPDTVSGLTYAIGFLLGTALLHVIGFGLGTELKYMQRIERPVVRMTGLITAAIGLTFTAVTQIA